MIKTMRIFSTLILSMLLFGGCGGFKTDSMELIPGLVELPGIGEADEPERHEGADDSLIGRFMRNIGPEEMDVLLHDNPDDPELDPALPINHLLYLLGNSDLDNMISITKQLGAERTRRLINAMKRIGCNKIEDSEGNHIFDIYDDSVDKLTDCTLDDFNHIQIMVDMVNGVQDIDKLVMLVRNVSIAEAPAIPLTDQEELDALERHMEKLAFMTVYLESTDKVFELVNGVIDPRDLVFFLDQMDNMGTEPDLVTPEPLEPPVRAAEIDNGEHLKGLYNVVKLNRAVLDPKKMFHLVNGSRLTPGNDGSPEDDEQDDNQRKYITQKLLLVIDGSSVRESANDPDVWADKLATMMNKIGDVSKMKEIMTGLNYSAVPEDNEIQNMIDMLILLDSPATSQSINALGYLIDHVQEPDKLVMMTAEVDYSNMATMINQIVFQTSTDPDPDIAGKKLATLVDQTTGVNYWDAGDPASATGIGKMVNMITNISDMAHLVTLIVNITQIEKLSDFTNGMTNSNLVVSYINAVIADPNADIDDMVILMNTLNLTDIPKVSALIAGLGGSKDALIAAMLAQYNGIAGGIGPTAMAGLLTGLTNPTVASGMAEFMLNLDSTLMYQSTTPNISDLEAMVRMIAHGVDYNGQTFPGLGAGYVATMMNTAEDHAALATGAVNFFELSGNVAMLGCGDHVSGFQVPCVASGMGW